MHSFCAENLDLNSFMDIMEDKIRYYYLLDSCALTVYNLEIINNGFSQIITHSVHLIHMVEFSRTQCHTGKCLFCIHGPIICC